MKKLLIIIISLIIFTDLSGCSKQDRNVNSEEAIRMYSHLSGFKGIELYVWKDKNELYFGMLEGTNRNKVQSDFDILYKNPTDIAKAMEILKGYKNDMYVLINSLDENLSTSDVEALKKQFDSLKMKNLTYFLE